MDIATLAMWGGALALGQLAVGNLGWTVLLGRRFVLWKRASRLEERVDS